LLAIFRDCEEGFDPAPTELMTAGEPTSTETIPISRPRAAAAMEKTVEELIEYFGVVVKPVDMTGARNERLMVTPIQVFNFDPSGMGNDISAGYAKPWYNHDGPNSKAHRFLEAAFRPAHEIDRWVRKSVWGQRP